MRNDYFRNISLSFISLLTLLIPMTTIAQTQSGPSPVAALMLSGSQGAASSHTECISVAQVADMDSYAACINDCEGALSFCLSLANDMLDPCIRSCESECGWLDPFCKPSCSSSCQQQSSSALTQCNQEYGRCSRNCRKL